MKYMVKGMALQKAMTERFEMMAPKGLECPETLMVPDQEESMKKSLFNAMKNMYEDLEKRLTTKLDQTVRINKSISISLCIRVPVCVLIRIIVKM